MSGLQKQIARFATTGALATGIHVVVALLLHESAGLSALAANFAAFLAALCWSYIGNALWTFLPEDGAAVAHRESLPRFALISVTGLCLNQSIVWVATEVLGIAFRYALIPVVLTVPAFIFLASRYWAFAVEPQEI